MTFLHARFSSVQLDCVKTSGLQVKALQKLFLIQHVEWRWFFIPYKSHSFKHLECIWSLKAIMQIYPIHFTVAYQQDRHADINRRIVLLNQSITALKTKMSILTSFDDVLLFCPLNPMCLFTINRPIKWNRNHM